MWRFMMITFAFLGWAFYDLSGGSDYEPRLQSFQARAKLDDIRPTARPVPTALAALPQEATTSAENEEVVARALSSLDDLRLSSDDKVQVTLASISASEESEPVFETEKQKSDILTQTPGIDGSQDQMEPETVAARDIRQVTGTVVNMRDGPSTFYLAIGKLKQGDEVEVLDTSDDGWLKIRVVATSEEGWMADWLATAASN